MFDRLKAIVKRALTPRPPMYVGLPSKGIYHLETCTYGRRIRRGVAFATQSQASDAGFAPCMVCQPDRHPYDRSEWVPDFWESREWD